MTIEEVVAKLNTIDRLWSLRNEDKLKEDNIPETINLLFEYKDELLKKKIAK